MWLHDVGERVGALPPPLKLPAKLVLRSVKFHAEVSVARNATSKREATRQAEMNCGLLYHLRSRKNKNGLVPNLSHPRYFVRFLGIRAQALSRYAHDRERM